jgi:hypothetical protein
MHTHQRAGAENRLRRHDLPYPKGEIQLHRGRDRELSRSGQAGVGGNSLGGGFRDPLPHAQEEGHSPLRAECQASPAGGGDRLPCGPIRHGDHRHQHGRTGHGHQAGYAGGQTSPLPAGDAGQRGRLSLFGRAEVPGRRPLRTSHRRHDRGTRVRPDSSFLWKTI